LNPDTDKAISDDGYNSIEEVTTAAREYVNEALGIEND
jgi:hypothetical protein